MGIHVSGYLMKSPGSILKKVKLPES